MQVSRFPPRRPPRPPRRASAVRLHCPRQGGRRVTDAPTKRGAAGWWYTLRRRKVVQWSLVYVAAAWAQSFVARILGNLGTVDTSRTAALVYVYRGAVEQSTEAAERDARLDLAATGT